MGGTGKTEIAKEYMFSREDKFDAIFWLNGDTPQKLNLGFSEISRALVLENGLNVKSDEIATSEIVKRWLLKPIIAANQGTPRADEEAFWLIIFDNVGYHVRLLAFGKRWKYHNHQQKPTSDG